MRKKPGAIGVGMLCLARVIKFTIARKHLLIGIGVVLLLGISSASFAGMRWSARAIDPSLIDAIRSDSELLEETLFGKPPEAFTKKLKKEGHVGFSDKQMMDELQAWAEKRRAEVGDTEVDLDRPQRVGPDSLRSM